MDHSLWIVSRTINLICDDRHGYGLQGLYHHGDDLNDRVLSMDYKDVFSLVYQSRHDLREDA